MKDKPQWVPVTGLIVTIALAVYMVVQMNAQAPSASRDFSAAAAAEVLDSQGQVVLRGQFAPVDEDDGDIERKAVLEPTGVDADAAGNAEVEIDKAAPANQEIEFSIRNVQSGATYRFMIDGQEVATATADARGEAAVEMD